MYVVCCALSVVCANAGVQILAWGLSFKLSISSPLSISAWGAHDTLTYYITLQYVAQPYLTHIHTYCNLAHSYMHTYTPTYIDTHIQAHMRTCIHTYRDTQGTRRTTQDARNYFLFPQQFLSIPSVVLILLGPAAFAPANLCSSWRRCRLSLSRVACASMVALWMRRQRR